MTHIGADVSFVGAEKEGVIRISGRARRTAIEDGVNMGQIMHDVSKVYGGTGGGHDGAAGLDVEGGDVEAILKGCLDMTVEILQRHKNG